MSHYQYATKGTCAKQIDFDLNDGKLSNVKFEGGCKGNLKAIGKLIEGSDAQSIANILKGNTCGKRPTSCADQLAIAIEGAISGELPSVE